MTVRRRSLVAGAAWSLPVLAVASRVPAFAASPLNCNDLGLSMPSEFPQVGDELVVTYQGAPASGAIAEQVSVSWASPDIDLTLSGGPGTYTVDSVSCLPLETPSSGTFTLTTAMCSTAVNVTGQGKCPDLSGTNAAELAEPASDSEKDGYAALPVYDASAGSGALYQLGNFEPISVPVGDWVDIRPFGGDELPYDTQDPCHPVIYELATYGATNELPPGLSADPYTGRITGTMGDWEGPGSGENPPGYNFLLTYSIPGCTDVRAFGFAFYQ